MNWFFDYTDTTRRRKRYHPPPFFLEIDATHPYYMADDFGTKFFLFPDDFQKILIEGIEKCLTTGMWRKTMS